MFYLLMKWIAHTLPFFFFNDTATTEIYTLSYTTLFRSANTRNAVGRLIDGLSVHTNASAIDRKSTRLNSSHQLISYAVLCLKKKKSEPSVTTRQVSIRNVTPSTKPKTHR